MKKIILMGDSIIAYIPKNSIGEKDDEVKNRGIENIGIERYRKYVWPKIEHSGIDAYVLLLGINNILRPDCDYDEEQAIDDVIVKLERFINEILQFSTGKLIVESLLPTKYEDANQSVRYVNGKLAELCGEKNIEFIDLYNSFVDNNGIINNQYSDDGIHLNRLGYEILIRKINERLRARNMEYEER